MMQVGYKLFAEAFGPRELVRQAVRAEEVGFDFVAISDHYHPWLDNQGHSPFAWSVLGAIAERTQHLGLVTGVTCPTIRYHPSVIAQAAATVALMSDGRFTLGVGSGERLNEHVVGRGFPSVTERHRLLREALEIIRLLWQGGYQSYDGRYLRLEDARVFDLPSDPPDIAVAAAGETAARLAAQLGDGLVANQADDTITAAYAAEGGAGPRFAEVPVAWAADEQTGAQAALDTARWALTGWSVMSELPNPVNFDAATTTVRADDVAAVFACGQDPAKVAATAQPYADAGFDHLVMMNAGPDVDEFLAAYHDGLGSRLRALASAEARTGA